MERWSTAVAPVSSSSRELASRTISVLGPLNQPTASFGLTDVLHERSGSRREAILKTAFETFWARLPNSRIPPPQDPPTELARRLDELAQELSKVLPSTLLEENDPSKELLAESNESWTSIKRQMIAFQEELDWRCYHLYGLIDEDLIYEDWGSLPEVDLGERPFRDRPS